MAKARKGSPGIRGERVLWEGIINYLTGPRGVGAPEVAVYTAEGRLGASGEPVWAISGGPLSAQEWVDRVWPVIVDRAERMRTLRNAGGMLEIYTDFEGVRTKRPTTRAGRKRRSEAAEVLKKAREPFRVASRYRKAFLSAQAQIARLTKAVEARRARGLKPTEAQRKRLKAAKERSRYNGRKYEALIDQVPVVPSGVLEAELKNRYRAAGLNPDHPAVEESLDVQREYLYQMGGNVGVLEGGRIVPLLERMQRTERLFVEEGEWERVTLHTVALLYDSEGKAGVSRDSLEALFA